MPRDGVVRMYKTRKTTAHTHVPLSRPCTLTPIPFPSGTRLNTCDEAAVVYTGMKSVALMSMTIHLALRIELSIGLGPATGIAYTPMNKAWCSD